MLKIFNIIIVFCVSLFAEQFYAKLEPIYTYKIKSAVSGKIVFVNNEIEGYIANKSALIKIDSSVDRKELKYTKEKLKVIENILNIEQNNLKRLNKIRSKSKLEKDNQKIKILNLQSSIYDLQIKIKKLQDQIEKKYIVLPKLYIYNIVVKKDDYVNPGSLLLTAMDISKGKLDVFIPIEQVDDIKKKIIYLDGKKSDLKISKIYKVADTKNISSYKCEIIVDNPKKISKIIKIEFK